MGLQLELEKSVTENLEANNLPTSGGRRRRRGGADEEGSAVESAKPAASYGLTTILKIAYDAIKKGTYAATQVGVAAAIVYATDQTFRADLCDPLAKSLASTMSIVPMAQAYAMKCDNAMTMYNSALTSSILLITPILMVAIKTTGSIFVSDEAIENVATELVEAAKNPGAAAAKAMTTRSKAKVEDTKAPPPPPSRRGGKRKTKKRTTRSRKTRRSKITFSY